jgi:prepilin-type N-terminal cleavage/methylation domain-containing protein
MISSRCDRRQGFSLIEMLIVIVVVGLVTLSGWPRLRDAKIRSDVRSARGQVIGLYAKARASAVETARPTTLQFSGTSAWITASPRLTALAGSTVDTIGGVSNLFTTYGVGVAAAPFTVVTVDPRGVGNSGATTIRLTRAGIVDSIRFSAFGKVQK